MATRWLRKPEGRLAIFGIFLAIVFGIWGIYSHFANRESREITFAYTNHKLFDASKPVQGLRVSDDKGNAIDADVFVSELTIWNSGNRDLDANLIREPLSIIPPSPDPKFRILSAQPIKARHFAVAGYSIDASSGNATALKWKYLDVGSGLTIRITYKGNSEAEWRIGGVVAGTDVNVFSKQKRETTSAGFIFSIVIAVIFSLGFVGTIFFIISEWKNVRSKWYNVIGPAIGLAFTATLVVFSIIAIWSYIRNQRIPDFPLIG